MSLFYFCRYSIEGRTVFYGAELVYLNPLFKSYANKSKKNFNWIGWRTREKIHG
ncbi:MAG: hypothetical protein ACJAS1_001300 [Oleiphilaceae bacterium]|jgi:hypothetical protein